jgi:hypothetical protein
MSVIATVRSLLAYWMGGASRKLNINITHEVIYDNIILFKEIEFNTTFIKEIENNTVLIEETQL